MVRGLFSLNYQLEGFKNENFTLQANLEQSKFKIDSSNEKAGVSVFHTFLSELG